MVPLPSIRPATTRDAAHLVVLIDIASEGLASFLWQQIAAPDQSPLEVGRTRALRQTGSFNWRSAHIAERDGEVAGALIGYVIDEPPDPAEVAELGPLVRPLVALEAQAHGYWYVNVLAVYPEHRGSGVGTALLRHADQLAGRSTAKGMALIVASTNTGARRLYERHGYRFAASEPTGATPDIELEGDWLLLLKPHS